MSNFSSMRKNMVDGQIHTASVVDERVLQAFQTTPRELCVPERLQNVSYTDESIDIGQGRSLMEPITHAKILQAAALREDDVVLDIGSASGYSSAILSPIVSTVIAVEHNKRQCDRAKRLWESRGLCNIVLVENKLTQGALEHAPYSLVIINGAVPKIPSNITDQMALGGRLITVIKQRDEIVGKAVLFIKDDQGYVSSRPLFDAGVRNLEEFDLEPDFIF